MVGKSEHFVRTKHRRYFSENKRLEKLVDSLRIQFGKTKQCMITAFSLAKFRLCLSHKQCPRKYWGIELLLNFRFLEYVHNADKDLFVGKIFIDTCSFAIQ
jgi:hypothetical protein